MSNDYNKLADDYQKTAEKPDKKYSILPTVLKLAGDLEGKTVVDFGCGDGYFTRELAQNADQVIGLDNSEEQLSLANQRPEPNVEYKLQDIFEGPLPQMDVAVVPFVVNYAKSIEQLESFFKSIYESQNSDGRVVFVVDLPTGKDLRKFGAIKSVDKGQDGAPIKIELFNDSQLVCTLAATYFRPETLEAALAKAGFCKVAWHKPIISDEGVVALGSDFWNGYLDNCELGYITAEK